VVDCCGSTIPRIWTGRSGAAKWEEWIKTALSADVFMHSSFELCTCGLDICNGLVPALPASCGLVAVMLLRHDMQQAYAAADSYLAISWAQVKAQNPV
jgi:hypothetical protein